MAVLGLMLFALIFVLLMPSCQVFLQVTATNASSFLHNWAPFSYMLLAAMVSGPIASAYILYTWPARVEPENPMSKYNRELPEED